MLHVRDFMIRHLACGFSAAILGGCNPSAPPSDPYDQSKMDLKPAPARDIALKWLEPRLNQITGRLTRRRVRPPACRRCSPG